MDDNIATVSIVGIIALVAVVGLVLFAMKGSSPSGSVAVFDEQGNLLYTVSDQSRRVVGRVDFQPVGP